MKAEHQLSQNTADSYVRDKARQHLLLAAKPPYIPGGIRVREDNERASRDAQIGLAYALLDLADALRETQTGDTP